MGKRVWFAGGGLGPVCRGKCAQRGSTEKTPFLSVLSLVNTTFIFMIDGVFVFNKMRYGLCRERG